MRREASAARRGAKLALTFMAESIHSFVASTGQPDARQRRLPTEPATQKLRRTAGNLERGIVRATWLKAHLKSRVL